MLAMSPLRCRLAPTIISAAVFLGAASVAHAEFVADAPGDFLPSYFGPKNGDMDALSSEVTLNPNNNLVTFTATVNGPVGTTTPGAPNGAAWVWGLDRGKGTERFLPDFGAGVKFDSVVALFADGTGAFIDLIPSPTPHPLAPGSVHVNGNTISATVPLSMMPSEGFAAQDYTWNFWPESIFAQPPYVSDFAPDARNATLTIVPEPSAGVLLLVGALAAGALRLRRKNHLA